MNKFLPLVYLGMISLTFVIVFLLELFKIKLENILFPAVFMAFVAANIADVGSSYLCSRINNIEESNPILKNHGILALIFLKLISTLTFLICIMLILDAFPFVPWLKYVPLALSLSLTILIFAAAGNNLLLVKKKRMIAKHNI